MALVGYTNAGKTTLFNRLTQVRRRGLERAVRDARSAGAPCPAARPARAAAVRHGRASSIGCRMRWWPRSARRSRKRRKPTWCCTSSTRRRPSANGTWRRSRACSRRWARPTCRASMCSTSAIGCRPTRRRRLCEADPSAVAHFGGDRRGDRRVDGDHRREAGAGSAARVARVRPVVRMPIASAWRGCIGTRSVHSQVTQRRPRGRSRPTCRGGCSIGCAQPGSRQRVEPAA